MMDLELLTGEVCSRSPSNRELWGNPELNFSTSQVGFQCRSSQSIGLSWMNLEKKKKKLSLFRLLRIDEGIVQMPPEPDERACCDKN